MINRIVKMVDNTIDIWKMKKFIQMMKEVKGNGTSMISLILPPNSQVSLTNKMLTEEYGTATNIKSRVNRLSVLEAISTVQQRLKLYKSVPPNGLLLYSGTILTDEGKEKKILIDIEPFRPINTSLYMCDSKFHVDCLNQLIQDQETFGFIVMNGDGCLFGTVQGNTKTVVQKISVDLPNKHRRGGQSALRFARLRMEARKNYLHKVGELATQHFIQNDVCWVRAIILAGSADFKTELSKSDWFDPRLQAKVAQIVDISYGGEQGFHQAIQLSNETLGHMRFAQEQKVLQCFFQEIQLDSGKYFFGLEDTVKALDMGAVETLIVWDQLPLEIPLIRVKETGEETVQLLGSTKQDHEVIGKTLFTDWISSHYKDFGASLEIVSDASAEGTQFVKGFSGLGGILRWSVNFDHFEEQQPITPEDEYDDFL